MKVGIGYCNNRDAYYSGRSAAGDATRNGDLQRKDFAIAFCAGKLDHEGFLRGIKEIIGDAPIIGGSSVGIITNTNLSYSGFPSGVAVFQFDDIKYQIANVGDLDKNENAAGRSLANKLSNTQEDRLLLMFYDSIKVPATAASPPVLNASPPLIAGIESNLQSSLPVIGAGLIGDYQFNKVKQFCGTGIHQILYVQVNRLSNFLKSGQSI